MKTLLLSISLLSLIACGDITPSKPADTIYPAVTSGRLIEKSFGIYTDTKYNLDCTYTYAQIGDGSCKIGCVPIGINLYKFCEGGNEFYTGAADGKIFTYGTTTLTPSCAKIWTVTTKTNDDGVVYNCADDIKKTPLPGFWTGRTEYNLNSNTDYDLPY